MEYLQQIAFVMKKQKSKVTLKDIAKDTGFSISTVSRAISGNKKISSDTERVIFRSAHKLNYPIQTVNTPVELRENMFIALVTKFHTGEFYSSFYNGLDNATEGTKTNIALLSVSNSSTDNITLINGLQKSNFDAAILFLPDFSQDDYKEVINTIDPGFPMVSVATIMHPIMDTITFDTYRGGYLVAEHFHAMGYKKLGIIHGPQNKSEAMLRKNGFTDFISLKEDLQLVWQHDGDFENRSGAEAYDNYKIADTKPEAVFCSNDSMAVGFMQNALRDGLRIPDDVAVAGYDDLPICEYHSPSITSVHTPFELLGEKAIKYLMDSLNNDAGTADHTGYVSLVPVTLKTRESTTGKK